MAKKKSSGTDLGFSLLVQAFRFGIAWSGRFLNQLLIFLTFLFRNIKGWNVRFDLWVNVQLGHKIPMPIKIGLGILIFYFLGFYIITILLLYLILKSF